MEGQMSIFDFIEHYSPLREVAEMASPYWTSSRKKLNNMLQNVPDLKTFAAAVRHEYCPYGLNGHYGSPRSNTNCVYAYDMMTNKIKVQYFDERGNDTERWFSWEDFSRVLRDVILRG